MDVTAHYRNLVALGRREFLAAAAPAVLVRYRNRDSTGKMPAYDDAETVDEFSRATRKITHREGTAPTELVIYPLAKKPGASFPDRITIGRTPNNDICIADHSVSRLHAYVRMEGHGKRWCVADAGSKNGSWLGFDKLEPRKERDLSSRASMRMGEIELTFYSAADLFELLGGTS
jgi:pSer/pThr/pTyr-binding forkhead associated (FHA) protein